MNVQLVNDISNVIRHADGNNTLGAGALAEVIVNALADLADDERVADAAVDALIEDGWEETHEGPSGVGTLSREDLRNIARTVLRSTLVGED